MTGHLRRIAAAAAVAALPLGACAPAAGVAAGPAAMQGDLAAHAFLSAVDAGEIETSMLAQERGADPTVRMFAMSMIAAHSNALQAREARMAQLGAGGLGLPHTAWTPMEARWATVTPAAGLQPAARPGEAQGQLQPAVGVQPHGPPAHHQQVQPTEAPPAVQQGPPSPQPRVERPVPAGTPAHGPPAHLQHGEMQQIEGRPVHGQMHHGAEMAAMQPWAATRLRHEAVLTPAGLTTLRGALNQHPMARPIAEASAREVERLRTLSGRQFDVAYMDAQVTAHRYALENLDRMIAQGGVSPEMLGVLTTTRASVASHLEMAQAIRARL
jgi:predicted outer membrane protein